MNNLDNLDEWVLDLNDRNVTTLAARSASAAKETTVIIEGSMQKVQDGTKIASETAEALNKMDEALSSKNFLWQGL